MRLIRIVEPEGQNIKVFLLLFFQKKKILPSLFGKLEMALVFYAVQRRGSIHATLDRGMNKLFFGSVEAPFFRPGHTHKGQAGRASSSLADRPPRSGAKRALRRPAGLPRLAKPGAPLTTNTVSFSSEKEEDPSFSEEKEAKRLLVLVAGDVPGQATGNMPWLDASWMRQAAISLSISSNERPRVSGTRA